MPRGSAPPDGGVTTLTLGTIIGLTPFRLPDARLVAALRAAGAPGVLDPSRHDRPAEEEPARAG